MPVHFDRNAHGADAVVVVNRVKKHTDITSPLESGVIKMIAIGLGKKAQADLIHAYGAPGLRTYIPEVARIALASAPIALGIATLENGYEETAELHAWEPEEIEAGERRLLARNKRLLPRLPFDEIDVLIVDRMGKEISGTGMDTNVLGRVRIAGEPELPRPRVQHVIVLDLTDASHGNAIGIGLADLTTERVVAKIDRRATYINGITSGFFERGKIPITLPTDREAVETALERLPPERRRAPRVARILDTLHLDQFEATPALVAEARQPARGRRARPGRSSSTGSGASTRCGPASRRTARCSPSANPTTHREAPMEIERPPTSTLIKRLRDAVAGQATQHRLRPPRGRGGRAGDGAGRRGRRAWTPRRRARPSRPARPRSRSP